MPDVLTIEDLRRMLIESAGVSPGVDLDGDIVDVDFTDLGYDSIAVLETAARITSRYGTMIDDADLLKARSPQALLDLINGDVHRATIGGER